MLAELAKSPAESIDVAIGKLSLGNVGEDEVRSIIAEIVRSKSDFIKEKGESAQSGLMGLVMSKLRGKADGKLISKVLHEEVEKELHK